MWWHEEAVSNRDPPFQEVSDPTCHTVGQDDSQDWRHSVTQGQVKNNQYFLFSSFATIYKYALICYWLLIKQTIKLDSAVMPQL